MSSLSVVHASVKVAKFEVPETGTHNFWINDDEEVLYVAHCEAGLRALDVSGEIRGVMGPAFEDLQSDPRFERLKRRLGLQKL